MQHVMSEDEYLTCQDPERMVAFLGERFTERKHRLAMVACAFRLPAELVCAEIEKAMSLATSLADEHGSRETANSFRFTMLQRSGEFSTFPPTHLQKNLFAIAAVLLDDPAPHRGIPHVASYVGMLLGNELERMRGNFTFQWTQEIRQACYVEAEAACRIIRDVVGNPFRPLAIDQAWLTGTVVQLAQAAYDHRTERGTLDNARLAVLADSLEESGCTDARVLEHLRSSGDHWRGCHCVDALVGRK